jgi:hypothetical protein
MENDIKQEVLNRVKEENDLHASEKAIRNLEKTQYSIEGGFLCRKKQTRGKHGTEDTQTTVFLSEFLAWITSETITDNGKEITRDFQIKGMTIKDNRLLPALEVQAGKFAGLSWAQEGWGAKVVLFPGTTVKDQVRHCIQIISGDVKTDIFYGHTGWRKINGEQVFLHAGGAIGGTGSIAVKFEKGQEDLYRYTLPPAPPCKPEEDAATRQGLKASLDFLTLGSAAVTFPLWAFVYLAPLTTLIRPQPNFVLYIQGITGTFKSTIAVLANSHFGQFEGVEGLSNFNDTHGTLEKRAFILKDMPMICDDLHPASNRRNAESMEQTAQKLIRSYSNRTARGRLQSDLKEKGHFQPRGLCAITAEELLTVDSTLARLCVVSIEEGDIDRAKLTKLQSEAGFLPYAMTAYIGWIKKNMKEILSDFPARFRELRQAAEAEGKHRKLPEQVAFLAFGLHLATSFFRDCGIIDIEEAGRITALGWINFQKLSERQQQRITADNPIDRFFDILQILLIQHATRLEPLPTCDAAPIGAGDRLGYFDEEHLFLLPVAVWHSVQQFSQKEGSYFPLGKHAFFEMLRSKNIIEPSPKGESTVFLKIGGKSVRVLKIINEDIYRKTVTS